MATIHLAFFFHIPGVILLLVLLGTAYALFGAAFWAGVAYSLRDIDLPRPASLSASLSESHGLLLVPGDDLEVAGLEGLSGSHSSNMSSNGNSPINETRSIVAEQLEDLSVTGFGIASCFLNISTTVTPVLLAGVENHFGYSGLELLFVLFAVLGCIASIGLARMHLNGPIKTSD
jgi:hypothetical protein